MIWFKQTIGHACGLYALIHSVGNGPAKDFIIQETLLDKLLKEAQPLKPRPRADVLYNSAELERAHMSSAFKGDSAAPMAEEPNGYHFISFVKGTDGHLYELEGKLASQRPSLYIWTATGKRFESKADYFVRPLGGWNGPIVKF